MNPLIFGKDTTGGIVCVEPGNETCAVFTQDETGKVSKREVPMTHWMIYADQLSPKMKPLDGDQHYKYLMEYTDRDKYRDVLQQSRNKRIDLYTVRDDKEAFLTKSGMTYHKGLKVSHVSALSFDLEHTFGVGDEMKKDGKLLLISNTFRSGGKLQRKLFAFDNYPNEQTMIADWCGWVREKDPSIILGHNIFGHDFNILRFAAKRAGISLNLGRDGSATWFDTRNSVKRKDGSQSYDFFNAHIYGREIVDTFFLAITFDVARNYESYGLKQIIKQEGLERKGRTHYDASQIHKDYLDPAKWAHIKAYAEDDADDALALFNLMIAPFFYSARSIPRSLQAIVNSATGSQINGMMVRSYIQIGHGIAKASEKEEFQGAISFGVPGLRKNVLRFDVASLYPSIMRQFKIYHAGKDPKAHFLNMLNYFTEERLKNKATAKATGDRYFKDLEQSQKILINSMYGFMGAGRLNYNYPAGANEVTLRGREILKRAIFKLTGKQYEWEHEKVEIEEEEFA
jgi:DNA polymerase elongation subunit (family B)